MASWCSACGVQEIKVNLATILPLIDENRPIKHRVVVASFPERSNRMWRYFEQRR
jgi:hypothetical protein